jgi:hypothetical protein
LLQILQEVAAARRILIVCGSAEIDGYSFCLGLKSLEDYYKARPDLLSLIRSVNYLIRQANFRPTQGICWSDMSFLTIRPLGELLDMFHTHEATERHDKVYALLGMSSDAHNTVDLLPDYKLPWKAVFHQLIKFLIDVSAETWEDREFAVIKSRGTFIGRISSVTPSLGWGDTNKVEVVSTTTSGFIQRWTWKLYSSAKPIRQGDLLFLQQGAPMPMIIRSRNEYFAILMIAVAPPKGILVETQIGQSTTRTHTTWPELLKATETFMHKLFLIWNSKWRRNQVHLVGKRPRTTGVRHQSLRPVGQCTQIVADVLGPRLLERA